ncbi:MAG: hypothetical protein IPF41_16350 [Flavobacteriales bacterium]|nr:hypothetical protein [Flavobacteriales bacterium]
MLVCDTGPFSTCTVGSNADHAGSSAWNHRAGTAGGQHWEWSTQWVDATGALDDDRAMDDVPARPRGPDAGSLGAIIAAFKSETTKRINRLNGVTGHRLWQPGYYERAIRQQGGEYGRIAQYIAENPAKWR